MIINQTNNNVGDVNNVSSQEGQTPECDRASQVRIVYISNERLCEMLKLPPGTRIEGFDVERSWRSIAPDLVAKISSPDFSPVVEAHQIPAVRPQYRVIETNPPTVEFVGWE